MALDPVELSKELIAFPSVNPKDEGAIDYVEDTLRNLGFACTILEFGIGEAKVRNLYARRGDAYPNLCFCGHVDVVPTGQLSKWTYPPFAAKVHDGILYGRGAADMKSAICAYIAAVSRAEKDRARGSLSFVITSDEEGPNPEYGTKAVLDWLKSRGEKIDLCLIGEATSSEELGDTVKIGRRGMIQFELDCHGKQGHAGYPELADNPIDKMIDILHKFKTTPLDAGNEYFQPSHSVITSVDANNPMHNIIPNSIISHFTIRYNTEHTPQSLIALVDGICKGVTSKYELTSTVSGEAFLTKEKEHAELMISSIKKHTGKTAKLGTGGGTSDARFVKNFCSVIEFGLVNKTIHQIDECTKVADIYKLSEIYEEFITEYFLQR